MTLKIISLKSNMTHEWEMQLNAINTSDGDNHKCAYIYTIYIYIYLRMFIYILSFKLYIKIFFFLYRTIIRKRKQILSSVFRSHTKSRSAITDNDQNNNAVISCVTDVLTATAGAPHVRLEIKANSATRTVNVKLVMHTHAQSGAVVF